MLFADVILLGRVYLFSLVWQWISFPWLHKLFAPTLKDAGWAMGRLITTLLVSWLIFVVATLGLPINNSFCLWLVMLLLLIVGTVSVVRNRNQWRKKIRALLPIILVEEILFLLGLMFMGVMRGFWPNLDNLEKFMDLGFINQYLLSPKLPAPDMWLAGQAINYYSFGHFWASEIIRWLIVKPILGFNLVLAIFFGFSLMLSFAVVVNIITVKNWRKRIVGGLVGAGLVCLGGNSHILWFMIKNRGLWEGDTPYWYALATRFIPQTIHEFPAYTFTVGDLHAHLIDLPIVLTFLLIWVAWGKLVKEKWLSIQLEALMGILLGIMVMTNTWDGLVYGLFLLVFLVLKWLKSEKKWREVIRTLLIVSGVAILISTPWWWSFQPITESIKWVTTRSAWWQLAVLWSGQILFGVTALLVSKKNILVKSLLISALILIMIPEVIYFKDIYFTYPRANTMFKLTYQAFVMLSLLGGVAVGETITKKYWLFSVFLILVVGGLLIYPKTSYSNAYTHFKEYVGLTNEAWLVGDMPDKYGAIVYLKNHRDGKNLIESPGKSFSLSNGVSVFSGVSTVLGWRDHEYLWRSDEKVVINRTEEIRSVYETPRSDEAKIVIEKYKVGWIIVGQEEREKYLINKGALKKMGEVVWEEGANYLLKIN